MPVSERLDKQRIMRQLDDLLEVEFSFLHTDAIAEVLAVLPRDRQEFILQWTRRVASTNVQLGYEFSRRGKQALERMDEEMIGAWCLHAMDSYDRAGLHAAMSVLKDLNGFRELGHLWAASSQLEEASGVLLPFLHGLAGRRLKLDSAEIAWTDGETIFLPEMLARLEDRRDNFQLYKALAAHLWAQTRFGTLNIDPGPAFCSYPDPVRAQAVYHSLETIRLDTIKSKGYVFQIEMKFHAWKYGFKIIEVPIVFTNREKGVSKMSGGIFNEAIWGVIKLKITSLFKSYKA